MEKGLRDLVDSIQPSDAAVRQEAQDYLDSLAKPPGSLGQLEEMAARLAGITGTLHNHLDKRCVLVFASDNGVVEEGVASCPQNVTTLQTLNMLKGMTGVAVLAQEFGSDLWVTDVGVNSDLHHPQLRGAKLGYGTQNITKGPAMSREQALTAIQVGAKTAQDAADDGYRVLGVGEMGIGNTTTSSAVLCGLLGLAEDEVSKTVGRGAGLTDQAYDKKVRTVQKALVVNKPGPGDPVNVLAGVGGFDLAAMTGAFLGAASRRVPVVIDGFISVVAGLSAYLICPTVRDYLFASHISCEKGYALAQEALALPSHLNLGMRLGEGSGCPLMFSVMDGACAVINHMATFSKAQIDTSYLDEISKEESF